MNTWERVKLAIVQNEKAMENNQQLLHYLEDDITEKQKKELTNQFNALANQANELLYIKQDLNPLY